MLVCNVSMRPPRRAIAAELAEAGTAADALGTGNVVFATLVDDPASVADVVDAYLGEIMLEAASASDSPDAGLAFGAAIVETVAAAETSDGTISTTPSPPLDAVASVTGAWSLSRDMLTSWGGATRYTKSGTDVITLKDQSGNSRDFSNSAGVSPAEATAFPASVLCADFDGTNDTLINTATSNFFSSSSGALVISLIIDAVSLNDPASYLNHAIFDDPPGDYMGLFAAAASGVTFYAYNWDGNEDKTTVTGSVGTAYVLMWRHNGGNLYVSVNGGTETSVASGNTQNMTNNLRLGLGGGSRFCNMKVAELFTTSNGSQTTALAAAIANMKSYIGA